jgi:hypothetical protein
MRKEVQKAIIRQDVAPDSLVIDNVLGRQLAVVGRFLQWQRLGRSGVEIIHENARARQKNVSRQDDLTSSITHMEPSTRIPGTTTN